MGDNHLCFVCVHTHKSNRKRRLGGWDGGKGMGRGWKGMEGEGRKGKGKYEDRSA